MGEPINERSSWDAYAARSGHMAGVTTDEAGQMWKNGHPFYPEHGGELPGADGRLELPRDMYKRSAGPQLVSEASMAADEAAMQRAEAAGVFGGGEPGFLDPKFLGNPAGAFARMNPPRAAAQGEVWDIDVTVAELLNLAASNSLHLYAVLEFLRANWVGGNAEREHDVRVGTMYAYVDEDGHLRLDFRSRFTVGKDLMGLLQETIRKAGQLAPEVVRAAGDVCQELNDKIEHEVGCCGFGDFAGTAKQELTSRAIALARLVGQDHPRATPAGDTPFSDAKARADARFRELTPEEEKELAESSDNACSMFDGL